MAKTATELGEAYASKGAALDLGAVVIDDAPHPEARVRMPLSMLNRHGLVAGATGTGKTKTLQLMAEQMSAAGIPVFLADIKGDVSGVAAPGTDNERIQERGGVAKVLGSSAFRSFARSAASAAGREISRSLFGTASRRRRRR